MTVHPFGYLRCHDTGRMIWVMTTTDRVTVSQILDDGTELRFDMARWAAEERDDVEILDCDRNGHRMRGPSPTSGRCADCGFEG